MMRTLNKIVRYLLLPFIMLTFFLARPVWAGDFGENIEQWTDQYSIAAAELARWFQGEGVRRAVESDKPQAQLGLVLTNISFKDAYDLKYEAGYGVLVKGSRYNVVDQGLCRNDILMEMDGIEIQYLSNLEKMVAEKKIGDQVRIKYFRDGLIDEKTITIDGQPRRIKDPFTYQRLAKKSAGIGGAAYKPMLITIDQGPLDDLLESLDFSALPLKASIYHGFDFQGLVGNGFFLGGVGTWTGSSELVVVTLDDQVKVTRDLRYRSKVWGVTLDKRKRLEDRWIVSAGLMLGGGRTSLQLYQVDGNFDWNELDQYPAVSFNDFVDLKKKYLLAQPRVALMYRVLPAFWLKLEAGYLLGYSAKGWKTYLDDSDFSIDGPSHDTALQGFTISISPWLGF
jgi:hypothetical protein